MLQRINCENLFIFRYFNLCSLSLSVPENNSKGSNRENGRGETWEARNIFLNGPKLSGAVKNKGGELDTFTDRVNKPWKRSRNAIFFNVPLSPSWGILIEGLKRENCWKKTLTWEDDPIVQSVSKKVQMLRSPEKRERREEWSEQRFSWPAT